MSTNIYNPGLQRSHEREFTGILDREIMANMAAHVVYVFREQMGLTQTVNVLRPYSAFNIPIQRRDPGPDGLVNTADDGSDGDDLRLRSRLSRRGLRGQRGAESSRIIAAITSTTLSSRWRGAHPPSGALRHRS